MSDLFIINGFCFSLFFLMFLSLIYLFDLKELASLSEEIDPSLKKHFKDPSEADIMPDP